MLYHLTCHPHSSIALQCSICMRGGLCNMSENLTESMMLSAQITAYSVGTTAVFTLE